MITSTDLEKGEAEAEDEDEDEDEGEGESQVTECVGVNLLLRIVRTV